MKMPVFILSVLLLSSFPRAVSAAILSESDISAEAAVVIEADSGRIIWKKAENKRLPMASTTKIMSVLLTLESGDIDSEFTVDREAVHTEGSSMGLREGDIVSKRDLCIGMLLPSGNDAANCAAVRVGGSIPDFVRMMNARAAEMGLMSTHFVTPSGLHDDEHYSTAYDMAVLASYALKNPDFSAICSEQTIALDYGAPPYRRHLSNTNKLLKMYDGCIGVKTGFTDEAGRCLVSAAERDGIRLICVTLDAPDDWNDHTKLYDNSFPLCRREFADDDISYDIDLAGGVSDTVMVVPECQPSYVNINGNDIQLTYRAVIPQLIYAPVCAGDEIGTLIVLDNGHEIAHIPLKAAEDAPQSISKPPKRNMIEFVKTLFKELLFEQVK